MFIVIPFFKNCVFLEEAILSIILQTDPKWTALILDDSIDPIEAKIAEACVKKFNDQRISYRKNPKNLGLVGNWKQGVDLASGHEFLVILHADDRLKPDYLSEMHSLTKAYPEATGYFCRTEIIDENGDRAFSFTDWYKAQLLPKEITIILQGLEGCTKLISGNFIFCPTICYRVSKLGRDHFRSDLKMVLDFELILRTLAAGGIWVGYYERPLFQYRRHAENTTVVLSKDLLRFKEEQALYLHLGDRLLNAGMLKAARKARQMRIVKLNLGFQILKSILKFDLRASISEAKMFLNLYRPSGSSIPRSGL